MSASLKSHSHGQTMVLTISNPEHRNALGPDIYAAGVEAINAADPEKFVLAYALAKITRYRDIVQRDRTQGKFLLGWLNRTLNGLKS